MIDRNIKSVRSLVACFLLLTFIFVTDVFNIPWNKENECHIRCHRILKLHHCTYCNLVELHLPIPQMEPRWQGLMCVPGCVGKPQWWIGQRLWQARQHDTAPTVQKESTNQLTVAWMESKRIAAHDSNSNGCSPPKKGTRSNRSQFGSGPSQVSHNCT
jgi:hypothetical protein